MIEPTRTAIDRRLPTHELNARRTRKRTTEPMLSTAVQRRTIISPQPMPLPEHAPMAGIDRTKGRWPST